ncbi:hypothetical protein R0K17_11680 [Planococcus sp. SIMBA_143]
MIIILVNTSVSIILFLFYQALKKRLKRGFFFEVSTLNIYKYYLAPLLISITNLLIFFFLDDRYMILILIPILVPVIINITKLVLNHIGKRKYLQFEKQIIPNIKRLLDMKGIRPENINIIFKDANKNNANIIEVVIKLSEAYPNSLDLKKSLEKEMHFLFQKEGYSLKVYLDMPYEKKSLNLDYCFG